MAHEQNNRERDLSPKNTPQVANAPILAFLDMFDTFAKKKKQCLKSGEVLFDVGENPYFYIVQSWALRIFKVNPSGDRKEVWVATAGSCIGEGVISGRNNKEVSAVAVNDVTSVVFFTKEELEEFEKKSPETMNELYKYIMNLASLRLAGVNKELSLLGEATVKMEEYKEQGEPGLHAALLHIKNALSTDYAIAIEQHPFVDGMFAIKYDTFSESPSLRNIRVPLAALPAISGERIANSMIEGTQIGDVLHFSRLMNAGTLRGYVVLGKHGGARFSDYESRIMEYLSPHFASIIENNQRIADERARGLLSDAT